METSRVRDSALPRAYLGPRDEVSFIGGASNGRGACSRPREVPSLFSFHFHFPRLFLFHFDPSVWPRGMVVDSIEHIRLFDVLLIIPIH